MSLAAAQQHVEVLPVGDAISRLIRVQHALLSLPHGVVNQRLTHESAALTEALNKLTINLGFECVLDDDDSMLDDAKNAAASTPIEIIRRGAETSCCRIVPVESPLRKNIREVVRGSEAPSTPQEQAAKPVAKRETSRSRD